jgi:hypothetical protein
VLIQTIKLFQNTCKAFRFSGSIEFHNDVLTFSGRLLRITFTAEAILVETASGNIAEASTSVKIEMIRGIFSLLLPKIAGC